MAPPERLLGVFSVLWHFAVSKSVFPQIDAMHWLRQRWDYWGLLGVPECSTEKWLLGCEGGGTSNIQMDHIELC